MAILLTGGTGYIASHTAVSLLEENIEVVLFDNLINSSIDVVQKLEKITNKKVNFIKGDIRDTQTLIKVIRENNINAVLHFAGLKAVGESVCKPLEYFENNVYGTISLLQAMQTCGVNKIVFSSSATVYGIPHYLPYDEEHPTMATNPYGRTKLHIEEILHDLAIADNTNKIVADKRWRIICLRYFNPVGAHSSGLIGENPQGIPNNLMPFVSQVAGGKLAKVNVFGNDYDTKDGTGVRDYIHITDLAQGHLAAYKILDTAIGWQAINLGAGVGYSVMEMINAFAQVCGRDLPFEIKPRRAGDIAISYAKAEKAQKVLNWQAKLSLEDMCKSQWNFQKNN